MLAVGEEPEVRKKGKRVIFESVAPEEGKTGPYVAYFPSGFPDVEGALSDDEDEEAGVKKGLAFSAFQNPVGRKRRQQMLVASSRNINYVGTSFGDENTGSGPCQYMVGVMDKKTRTLRFAPIAGDKLFRMEARVHGLDYGEVAIRDVERPEEEETAEEKYLKRRSLTDTFGGRKSKLAVQAMDRGAVREGKLAAPEAIDNIITTVGREAGPAAAAAPSMERNIPPHNLEATQPEDMYPLEGLIPPSDWESLDASALVHAAKKWPKRQEELRKTTNFPEFIHSKIPSIIIEGEKDKSGRQKRARMLLYLSYMFKFHQATIFPEKSMGQNFVQGFSKKIEIPQTICAGFLERFAERSVSQSSGRLAYGKPKKLRQLMIAYILMLVLTIDGFSSDPAGIANALLVDLRQVLLHYRELGCRVDVDRASKAKGASDAAAKYRVWLPVPLQFPIIKGPIRKQQ